MQTVTDLLFFLLLSLLFMHELDAIRRHEWRMFIILNKFEDEKAFQIFSLLHLPLFILVFWLLAQPVVVLIHFWFQVGLDLFLLVHKILHDHFQQHPANQFDEASRQWQQNGHDRVLRTWP